MKLLEHADYRSPAAAERVEVTDDGAGAHRMVRKIREFGFAVARMSPSTDGQRMLGIMARVLHLGEPYVPQLYRLPKAGYGSSYVDIRPNPDANHPSFSSGSAQSFHTDGLLEEIGIIRTSMLYCVRPARSGGRTAVLNVRAILAELRRDDMEAADLLFKPHILARRSTLPGVEAERVGPAFAYDSDGELLTRFGDGGPEQWRPNPDEVAVLRRARRYFADSALADGRYRLSLMLRQGDCLVFRNDWISHGREAFVDDPSLPRHLVRSLYLKAPRATIE